MRGRSNAWQDGVPTVLALDRLRSARDQARNPRFGPRMPQPLRGSEILRRLRLSHRMSGPGAHRRSEFCDTCNP